MYAKYLHVLYKPTRIENVFVLNFGVSPLQVNETGEMFPSSGHNWEEMRTARADLRAFTRVTIL